MNRIFGATGPGALQKVERTTSWLAEGAQGAARPIVATPELVVAIADDGGAVLGVARSAGLTLAYLGALHQPSAGFEGLNPLDDPHRTAAELLRRYEAAGKRFLDGVVGHYIVVVADADKGKLLLCRDPGGHRRVFVAADASGVSFSTKIADFKGLLGQRLEVDRSLENFLLGYEFLPWNRTPFKGVEVLPAGIAREYTKGSATDHAVVAAKPWDDLVSAVEPGRSTEAELIECLAEGCTRAIAEQSPTSGRIAVLLGGFDSALIAALLTRAGREVETFSFRYSEEGYNQPLTEELSRLLGIRHNWVPITPAVIREGLEAFGTRFNQLAGQPHYLVASAHAARCAREAGFTHMFTGDGCDGLFLGYPTVHLRAKFIMTLAKVAPLLRGPLGVATKVPAVERALGHPYRVARNVAQILTRPPAVRAHIASCILDEFALEQLRGPAPPQEKGVEEILAELARGLEGESPIRLAYRGKGMVGLNKNKLEGATDHSGMTIVSPYLHPGFARLAARLPEELSRPKERTRSEATGKYILMKMAEEKGWLPASIIYQKKMSPVTAPVDAWYLSELRPFMLKQLEGLPFSVDAEYAESLLSPRLSEDLFRRFVGISRFATHAINVLVTHAAFTHLAPRRMGHIGSTSP
jgi:asparagine synthetase B (glutamine-hydrolysing)